MILTFPANSGPFTTMNLEVPVANDNIVENTETINVQAVIVSGIATFINGGTSDTSVINILDDDGELI